MYDVAIVRNLGLGAKERHLVNVSDSLAAEGDIVSFKIDSPSLSYGCIVKIYSFLDERVVAVLEAIGQPKPYPMHDYYSKHEQTGA